MKANFIQFWCEESEFIVKNWFHNWTSELGCIWLIFRKSGHFWLFLSAPVQKISVNNPHFICSSWLLPVPKCLKRAKFSKNVPKTTYLWYPIMKLIFDFKFRFYNLKINEICLHCHLLYFSSIILIFGPLRRFRQCEVHSVLSVHSSVHNILFFFIQF